MAWPHDVDLRAYGLSFYPDYQPFPRRYYSEHWAPYLNPAGYSYEVVDDTHRPRAIFRRVSPMSKSIPIAGGKEAKPTTVYKPPTASTSIPAATQHNQLDVPLRLLSEEVSQALVVFHSFYRDFDKEVENIRAYADETTLDAIWNGKVQIKCRDPGEQHKLEGVANSITKCRETLLQSMNDTRTCKPNRETRYLMECQLRAGHKAVAYCDGVVDLAQRALKERVTCKQLVRELAEMRAMLDRKTHPWIYGDKDDESLNVSLGCPTPPRGESFGQGSGKANEEYHAGGATREKPEHLVG